MDELDCPKCGEWYQGIFGNFIHDWHCWGLKTAVLNFRYALVRPKMWRGWSL